MNPDRAMMIGRDLIKFHAPGTKLEVNRMVRTVGRSWWEGEKRIAVGYKWLISIGELAFIELMLHEIGHILARTPGHGRDWAFIVASIGGNPHTKFDEERYEREAAHRE